MGKYGLGTAFGNVIERKYLVNTTYAKSATSEAERKKFQALVQLFRKYSDQYNLDYLLMAAQGYQESQLDQNAKSAVGAIGIMQVMPATGKELNVGDIRQIEPNIHAGVKYMRVTADAFFKDEPMDDLNKGLFTFASYNAGPGRVRQLRREAEKARARSERLVRQRRSDRVRADRPRDGDLRRQHLQVLRRVPAGRRGGRAQGGGQGGGPSPQGQDVAPCPRQGARRRAVAARPIAVPRAPGEPHPHAYHPCDDEPPRRPWSRCAPAEDRRWPARRPDS